ncbi:hypothetical protein, variant 1 [Aphanomyces astaci]|uniref:Peptidase M3A/M3B catalytic domain-containing protein n=1 Tax=Aphanomyces astaci TaxID=112090 RepID=W4GFC0_APHAT|nr:hypothetical protein, variant 1 [Aphanomyces astaci]ETV78392.1 hypothetical protein, variant 1 [Aphanomyces astaci]|eukprot:XP_009831973.1 hypothetical protein, variant 1 [Aphanomyces astaci]
MIACKTRLWGRYGAGHAPVTSRTTTTRPSSFTTASHQTGLFGLQGLVRPDDFAALGARAIREIGRLKHRILSTPPGLSTIQDLDAISNEVCIVIDAAELCRNVHPDAQFRAAASNSFAQLSTLIQQLNTDTDMYQRLRDVTVDESLMATFTEEQRRVALLLRAEFERDGIHLDANGRANVISLQNDITRLSSEFQHNITTVREHIRVPQSALKDLPASYMRHCSVQGSSVLVPTDSHVMHAIMKWIPDPAVRKQMYLAGNTSPKQNLHVLDDLIQARHAVATTLGFPTYAHLATSDKMAESPDGVAAFLESIASNLMTKAKSERQLLAQAKRHHEPPNAGSIQQQLRTLFGQTTSSAHDDVESWDVPYYMGMLKARHHHLDSRVISAYFPVDRCIDGLRLICDQLFGVHLTDTAMAPHESWHPDVRKLVVTRHDRPVGVLFLDLYPRPNKYNHFAHFTIRCGKQLPTHYQTPVVALVCNFQQPTADTPPLLTHGEVETLFHEFGHALHSVLSQTEMQHVSGTRGQLDFVETPSHLFEYFAWDPRVVETFARHFDTNEPIPRSMVANLRASKHMFSAMDTQTQCLYSMLDLTLFGTQPLPFTPPTTTQALQTLQNQHTLVPFPTGTHWHTRFGHLVSRLKGEHTNKIILD